VTDDSVVHQPVQDTESNHRYREEEGEPDGRTPAEPATPGAPVFLAVEPVLVDMLFMIVAKGLFELFLVFFVHTFSSFTLCKPTYRP